ncbi:MAG: glycosyltransferase family 2 protein [Lachnospira sp.]
MDKQLVSIIVPAYNTGNFINNMLQCLINQTYQNLQIIIIDDGSTDETAEIIYSYAKIDSRIEYYYQSNQGVSAARNYGLEKVRGTKLFFFDSDDTFELNLIEECIKYSNDNKVESVLYGYADKINNIICNEHKFNIHGNFEVDSIVDYIIPAFLGHSYADIIKWLDGKCGLRDEKEHTALWRIMLDCNIIKNENLKFDTNLSLGEDTKFINTYLLYTNSVGILEKTLYYLTIREGSSNDENNANPVLMTENKLKLIEARKEIDQIALKKGIETNPYWQGTIVLYGVQLVFRLSHNKFLSRSENKKVYLKYIHNIDVINALNCFEPSFKLKAIPFFLLKNNKEKLLFNLCCFLPDKVIAKLGGL